MSWETKAWGRTRPTDSAPGLFSNHELEILAGGFCSLHYHEQRANQFYIIEGTLRIVEVYGWDVRVRTLRNGDRYTIPSLVTHQFQAITAVKCEERYFADRNGIVVDTDIIRLTIGGICPNGILASGVQVTATEYTTLDIRRSIA